MHIKKSILTGIFITIIQTSSAQSNPSIDEINFQEISFTRLFNKYLVASFSSQVIAPSIDSINVHKDQMNPLGPKAQYLRLLSYLQESKTKPRKERGLWIVLGNQEFNYRDFHLWRYTDNMKLEQVDLDRCKSSIRRTVKYLNKLKSKSNYANNLITTLEYSLRNKFEIKLQDITECYTLFPLPDNKRGFLNNNAYAFQIISQGELVVDYAPFDRIGCGAEIRWSPRMGFITLAHELGHAYDANYGLMSDELITAYGEVMSAREVRALYHENIIRKEMDIRLKTEANTGSAMILEDIPFTYPIPVEARY